MEFGGGVCGIFVFLALFCTTAYGDYVSHSDDKGEDNSEATAFTVLIVLGVVAAIQFVVFLLFACKGWDAVFGSRSIRSDPESQLANEFPFLPSYEMAINEVRASQQNINNIGTTPENPGIDNGVILGITSSGVTPTTGNQSNIIETVASVNTPRSSSLDDGVVLEIRSSSANTSSQESISTTDEQMETSPSNVTSPLENCSVDNEVELNVGPSSVHTT